MDYVTLNGTSSTTITGLLIQSLPPVSKPMMRTQIDEIDGRDGDIITELGYAAYDKTLYIGLHGSFDIDDVIAFFASEGTVIFSNEPTKYYKYKIIEQIDFAKLLRFRSAAVTFHVQPYKYAANESTRIFLGALGDSFTITNSGNVASRPTLTIYGSDDIELYLNGNLIFTIALGSEGNITIDTDGMNASKDGVLKNRLVDGDYDNFALVAGSNTLSYTGSVVSIEVSNYSRWI